MGHWSQHVATADDHVIADESSSSCDSAEVLRHCCLIVWLELGASNLIARVRSFWLATGREDVQSSVFADMHEGNPRSLDFLLDSPPEEKPAAAAPQELTLAPTQLDASQSDDEVNPEPSALGAFSEFTTPPRARRGPAHGAYFMPPCASIRGGRSKNSEV